MIQPIDNTPLVKDAAYYAACASVADVLEGIRKRLQNQPVAPLGVTTPASAGGSGSGSRRLARRRARRPVAVTPVGHA